MNLINIASAILITASGSTQEYIIPKKKRENILCTVKESNFDIYEFKKLTQNLFQIINKPLYEVITQISFLNNNWDGYNALAPSELVIKNLELQIVNLPNKFVENIDEDNVYPNPNGTITLEWKNNDGEIASIEIGEKTASFYANIKGQKLFTKTSNIENFAFFDSDSLYKINLVLK